jgi:hypothetical protein
MGSPAVLEALLKMRPDWLNAPSAQGSYLLHGAAFNGKVSTIQKLLELGARPDVALLKGSNFAQGSTALHMAASMGELEAVKLLLDAEPDLLYRVNANFETVLHEAACQQRPYVCQFLSELEPGLLVRPDRYGKRPLDVLEEAWQLYADQQQKTLQPGEKAPKKLEAEQLCLLDRLRQEWMAKTSYALPMSKYPFFLESGGERFYSQAQYDMSFNNQPSGQGVPVGVKPRFLQFPNRFRR